MFCHNCGNKLDENAMICLKCGVLIKEQQEKKVVKNENKSIQSIIGLIFGILSILLCFSFVFKDISGVGMYTKLFDRLYYVLDIVIAPAILSFITLIISINNKRENKDINKIGLFLSIISLFFVITEIVIVIIY